MGANNADIEEITALAEKIRANVYNVVFHNATSVRRVAAHGRLGEKGKEMAKKLVGVPDSSFCMALGTVGGRDTCPTDNKGRAGTLASPIFKAKYPDTGGA